jgi:8-oxo-dGTP pyrophosphatase MutT (NUDIX family)
MLYPNTTYNAHFGVYALIFNDKKDSVLLIKKALGCYTGLLDLPGGGMEPHETLEETLFREVNEETGCHITSCEQLGAFCVLYPYTEKGKNCILQHRAAIYTASITGTPNETSGGADDSHGCVWAPITSLNEKNTVPLVLDAIKRHQSRK